MTTPDVPAATFNNLTDSETSLLLFMMRNAHPDVAEHLLRQIDEHRRAVAERAAMPAHPFTGGETPGTQLCYWHRRTWCFRAENDPLHTGVTP